jgi:hypothetical protein
MILTRRSASKTVRRSFRPGLSQLDSRDLPSATPATHFLLSEPAFVQANKAFDLTVVAETASNSPAKGYAGTVHFSTMVADAGALGLSDYTFTAADKGVHTFHVTMTTTASTQTIMAMDGNLIGMASNSVAPAPIATQLHVSLPNHVTVGVAATVTVTALDASGRLVPNYTGTVDFSSTDSTMTGADVPSEYTFQATDNGSATFQVTFRTPSATMATTLNVTDGNLVGSATPIVKAATASATHFAIFEIGSATKNAATSFLIVALDANNRIVTDYSGTIHVTSSDGSATLPSDYTFQASDHGTKIVSATFGSTGKQSLTVGDATNSGATGSVSFRVDDKHSSWWSWWW